MLKIKEGYIMRKVAGETVVLPTGTDLPLNRMITLNGTGAFLWERLETGADEESLVTALLEAYDVDRDRAAQAVKTFVANLRENQFLEE